MPGFSRPVKQDGGKCRPEGRPPRGDAQQRHQPDKIPGIVGGSEKHCRRAQRRCPGRARDRVRWTAERADGETRHEYRCHREIGRDRHQNGSADEIENPEAAARGKVLFGEIRRQKPEHPRSDTQKRKIGGKDDRAKAGWPPPVAQI